MIFVAGAPELKARAAAFEGKRSIMPIPPPLSKYDEKPLIHINTDKPYYQPNEVVFIEAFFIDAISKKPIFARQDTMYPQLRYEPYSYLDVYASAQILDSDDKVIANLEQVKLFNGTAVFNLWRVPANQKGGEYKVKVETYYQNTPPSFRKIRIGNLQQPNLFVTVDFDKNAYSPGDTVEGKVKVRKPDGTKVPPGSSLAFTIGGIPVSQSNLKLDQQGEAKIKFTLPTTVA
jgi:uncharacterized protein YfaS (alpha-2-macroglobulin family)